MIIMNLNSISLSPKRIPTMMVLVVPIHVGAMMEGDSSTKRSEIIQPKIDTIIEKRNHR